MIISFFKNELAKMNLRFRSKESIFTEIYRKHRWGGKSRSGPGSDFEETEEIRCELPNVLEEYQITSMLDIPCGDFNWLRTIDFNSILYLGADIVHEIIVENKKKYSTINRSFVKRDILKNSLPKADLVLCRDLLVHFSNKDVLKALKNIKDSGSKYLLTTSFISQKENIDIVTGEWRPLNLLLPPFSFPKPIKIIREGYKREMKYNDKSLLLWKIIDLQNIAQISVC